MFINWTTPVSTSLKTQRTDERAALVETKPRPTFKNNLNLQSHRL